MLRSYEGTHSFEITVTDGNGGKTTKTLAIKYGQMVVVPPSIVWDGYNIDERQTYAPGMTCELKVTAPATIVDFGVKIISEDLTAEELASVNLAAEFSLVTDDQYFTALSGLGFKVGDEVYGQTSLDLSITTFLAILSGYPGDHDFEMTVTDAAGNVVVKTVMLHFN
jgi:hypothetical protein